MAAQDQADAFLSQAAPFLATGAVSQASNLLSSALQLAPDYSEALYLKARIELLQRSSTRDAVADLRLAIQNGSWRATDPNAVRLDFAELLLRVGKAGEALPFARQLATLHPEQTRTALLLTRCLAATGDAAAARLLASDEMARLPENDELRVLAATLQDQYGQHAAARETIATGLKIHPDSLRLLLSAAGWEPNPKNKLALVDAYLSHQGTDPLSAVLGLETTGSDKQKYLDAFLKLDGLSRQDLVDRATRAVKSVAALAATLRDALGVYSGVRDLDANGDGVWEDRWTFDKGILVAWRHEPFQDGVAELSATFAAGQPLSFGYRSADGTAIVMRYSRYPYVESAVPENGDTFLIVPYTLQCAFLKPFPSAGIGLLVPQPIALPGLPTLDQIRLAAYRQLSYGPDGTTITRRTDLQRGKSVYQEADENGAGRVDHRVWFTDGLPTRGERSLGASTVFTVKESYANGVLAGIDVDTDGDGVPDYHETYGAGTVKSWDWNEDGRADSREYTTASGELVRELSTSLNGIFDLRIVSDVNGIRAMTRAGRPVDITPDAARKIIWIGQPAPEGVTVETTSAEGVHAWGGREYLVFKESGTMYAEALE